MSETTRPYTNSIDNSTKIVQCIRYLLYRLSYRAANLVAANSEDGIEELIKYYGVRKKYSRRLPNLIEIDRVRNLASGDVPRLQAAHDSSTHRFCMVSRFDPMKRVDTLLMAAHHLDTNQSWHIDLVGDGPCRPAIEKSIGDLGLTDRITLHGWLANPYPIIAQASATVLCSEYEGFSNTVLESMTLGTPVVTSLCSTDAQNMVQRGAALGFPVGDCMKLSSHLRTVLTRPEICARLAERAAEYVRRHDVNLAVCEYENAIKAAIESINFRSSIEQT